HNRCSVSCSQAGSRVTTWQSLSSCAVVRSIPMRTPDAAALAVMETTRRLSTTTTDLSGELDAFSAESGKSLNLSASHKRVRLSLTISLAGSSRLPEAASCHRFCRGAAFGRGHGMAAILAIHLGEIKRQVVPAAVAACLSA